MLSAQHIILIHFRITCENVIMILKEKQRHQNLFLHLHACINGYTQPIYTTLYVLVYLSTEVYIVIYLLLWILSLLSFQYY